MNRPVPLRFKLLGALAVVLLGAGFVAYQSVKPGEPSFRRGGEFLAGGSPAVTAPPGRAPAPTPPPGGASPPPEAPPPSTTSSVTTAPPTSATTRSAPVTPTTRRAQAPAATTSPPTARPQTSAPAPPPSSAPAGPIAPRLPAFGTYTYAVDGQESVTFIGTRRFPGQMTTVVHGAPGLASDQVVFDIRYSQEHEEREIVGYRADGVYFDFEGGSVTFGPRTETSEDDYEPPMLQIPLPLEPGVARTGTTQAKRQDGTVARTEDWKVTISGMEKVAAAGGTVDAWKVQVDRRSRPGSAETITRQRTYWYDPARSIWVRYTEVVHGERRTGGFTFTYDANLTATLQSFSPS